jgi:hypothetical protein
MHRVYILLNLFGGTDWVWGTTASCFLLVQNFCREATFNELPVPMWSTWSYLDSRMLSSGCSAAMSLLVMIWPTLWAFCAMAGWLVLLWILRQGLRLLLYARIGLGVNYKIVNLLLLPQRMRLLVQEISLIRSTDPSLGNTHSCIPLFGGTWNTAASPRSFSLRSINWICDTCGCICRRGGLAHDDSTCNLRSSKNVPNRWPIVRETIHIHRTCIVDQDVI